MVNIQVTGEQIAQIQTLRYKAHNNYASCSAGSEWLQNRYYGEYEAYCRVLAILGVEPLPAGMSEN